MQNLKFDGGHKMGFSAFQLKQSMELNINVEFNLIWISFVWKHFENW